MLTMRQLYIDQLVRQVMREGKPYLCRYPDRCAHCLLFIYNSVIVLWKKDHAHS